MTKEELFKMMNDHPVMHVATNDNGQPHVRAILMFKADADGIVFHTGVTKDLYRQLLNDPRSEVCFACGKYQVRVEGCFELIEDMALKEEIVNHPSRKFLKPWREQQGDEAFFSFLKVFRMQHGKAHVWCMDLPPSRARGWARPPEANCCTAKRIRCPPKMGNLAHPRAHPSPEAEIQKY